MENYVNKRSSLVVLAAAYCLALGSTAADAGNNISPPSLEQIEAGRKIYNFRCYFCHGYSGNAQTVAASFLTPPPIDFTRADANLITPEYIISILRNGKPGTAMRPFLNILTETEMKQVATFVVDEFVQRKAHNTRYHTAENGPLRRSPSCWL